MRLKKLRNRKNGEDGEDLFYEGKGRYIKFSPI